MRITKHEIEEFDQRYRTTFINSLAGFRQAVLVGTQSENGIANLAIFNSLMHLGANPALLGLISRPDSVLRDTLENIKKSAFYTLNFIKASDFQKAHQTSARYPNNVSEFEKVGFSAEYQYPFPAPFVTEAVVKIGVKLEELIPIKTNGTLLIVGSVQEVILDENLVSNDGYIDLATPETLITQGLDAYFKAQPIGRLPYAKP